MRPPPAPVAPRDLDFEAYPGEVPALLGAKGAGKSAYPSPTVRSRAAAT